MDELAAVLNKNSPAERNRDKCRSWLWIYEYYSLCDIGNDAVITYLVPIHI
jgi:hypothetical protein